jgi:predicted ATPase
VEQVFSRARELCAQLGQSPELIPALWGLCWFSIGQGNPQVARELGEQLLGLVQESPHILSQVLAYNALGAALFWTGDFPRARFYLEQGMALYDPQQHHSPAYVTDLGVLCRCYAMLVLWSLGYPDQARSMARETLTIAYELSHAHSLAQTACHAALVHQLCREGRSTQESAECAVTVSAEQGFPLWSVTGLIVQAWTLAEQGQIEEGAARLHQALTRYSAINSSIIYPYFLGLLADAQRKAARPEEGLAVVTEALTRVEQTGARYYEAELWRLKGELLLAQART